MEAIERQANTKTHALTVRESLGLLGLSAIESEWNGLCDLLLAPPFYRPGFIRLWLQAFAPNSQLRILQAWQGGQLVAVLPLIAEDVSIYGVPVAQLTSPANSHSNRFDLLAQDSASTARAFMDFLAQDDSWELLRLVDVPENGAARSILETAQSLGWPYGAWESQRSPYLKLPKTFEAFDSMRPSKRRSESRRRLRRLSEMGNVEWRTEKHVLTESLNEGLKLEALGWKGSRGTAINQLDSTRSFYTSLAKWATQEGMLALSYLRLNQKLVAFDYGLVSNERYFSLKVGYDESFSSSSPGQLLTEYTLAQCIQQGVGEFDFLGDENESKREWTKTMRPHHWLYVFRNTAKGRMLCRAKFQLAPAAKRMLQRGEVRA